MNEYIFRVARIEDIADLVELRFKMISETSGMDPNQRTAEFEKAVHDYFNECLSNRTYFGAVAKVHLGTTDEGRGLYEKFGFGPASFPVLELRL